MRRSKDIIERALKTFVQAFIPVLVSAFAASAERPVSELKTILYSALVSAAAAGLSAAWNIISSFLSESEGAR